MTPISAYLEATITILETLKDSKAATPSREGVIEDAFDAADRLSSYLLQLKGSLSSVDVLQKRIQGILVLVSSINHRPCYQIKCQPADIIKNAEALSMKAQITAERVNDHLLHLTEETVEYSATVRIITVVTLIYLPSTFIAVLKFQFSFLSVACG